MALFILVSTFKSRYLYEVAAVLSSMLALCEKNISFSYGSVKDGMHNITQFSSCFVAIFPFKNQAIHRNQVLPVNSFDCTKLVYS